MAVASVSLWRRGRIWFCVLFFFIMLLPTSNVAVPIGTIMAERLLYVPSVGVCVLPGFLWQWFQDWSQQRQVAKPVSGSAFAVLVVILVSLGFRSVLRNRDWRDEYTLWRSALQVSPRSAKAHFYMGVGLLEKGLSEKAIGEFGEALRIYPFYPHVHLELGAAFLKKGDVDRAIQVFQEGTKLDPRDAALYINLGVAWMEKGRPDEAIAAYQRAIAVNPKSAATASLNWGNALVREGRLNDAVAAYQRAIRLKPDYLQAYNNLSYAYHKLGDEDAAREWRENS